MFKRLIFIIVSFLLTAPLVANADVSEATFTPQGSATYTPIDESQVEIYVFRPGFKFKVIGVIEARGMAESEVSILDQLDIVGRLLDSVVTR